MGVTNPTTGERIHDLDKRLVAVETAMRLGFEHIADRLDKISEDISDQGKTPKPVDRAPDPVKSGPWRLASVAPQTWMSLGSGIGLLVATAITAYTAALSGSSTGATRAVEDAVTLGEAVPVAATVVRVVPHPVPMPAPAAVPAEPDPVVRPDDLMPDQRETP